MISNNSLSAFSAAATAVPANGAGPARLVRDQANPIAARSLGAIAKDPPKIAPPRGSLVDISV